MALSPFLSYPVMFESEKITSRTDITYVPDRAIYYDPSITADAKDADNPIIYKIKYPNYGLDMGTTTYAPYITTDNYPYVTSNYPYVTTSASATSIYSYPNYGLDASNWISWPQQKPATRMREQIQANLAPQILIKGKLVSVAMAKNSILMRQNGDPAELRARMLLRDMIGEKEFKRYMTRGFIICHGRSGMMYKVTGGHERIMSFVQKDGKWLPHEMLCIITNEKMPFTDWVIWRKLMCEADEFALRKIANITKIAPVDVYATVAA